MAAATEQRAGGAKSVFHFDVQGSVAKSTHAGIPWLRFIRQRLGARVHFWPFDGWDIPVGHSAIAEVYPAEARALMGPDFWPYGVPPNRHTLSAQLEWSWLDGLQARKLEVSELFPRVFEDLV